jgi:hypothetical protein
LGFAYHDFCFGLVSCQHQQWKNHGLSNGLGRLASYYKYWAIAGFILKIIILNTALQINHNNINMHLILTGATGLVGSGVLDAMLQNSAISRISILSRRPVKMAEDAKDPRVHVITHKDFETYQPELLEQLKDADGCVWALGISQNSVDKEYEKSPISNTKHYAQIPQSNK